MAAKKKETKEKKDNKDKKDKKESIELSAEDVKKLKEAFALFDNDGSGTIEQEELLKIFCTLDPHITREEFKQMMKEYDTDGDGTIDWNEFKILMGPAILGADTHADNAHYHEDADVKAAFDIADADGSGKIDKKELGALLASLGETLTEEELNALMKEIDENGDGVIDFDEFKTLLAALS